MEDDVSLISAPELVLNTGEHSVCLDSQPNDVIELADYLGDEWTEMIVSNLSLVDSY